MKAWLLEKGTFTLSLIVKVSRWLARATWRFVKSAAQFLAVWAFGMVGVLTFVLSAFAGAVAFRDGPAHFSVPLAVACAAITLVPSLFVWIFGGGDVSGYILASLVGGFVGGAAVSIVIAILGFFNRLLVSLGAPLGPLDPARSAVYVAAIAIAFAILFPVLTAIHDLKIAIQNRRFVRKATQM